MKFKFNIPNKITIIRVLLIPLFALVLLAKVPHKNGLAAFIFSMLSISDFFDGYIARKKKQVTEIGKLIDPIADKLLVSTALIFLIGRGVELWMAVVIIAREIILTAIRIYLLPTKIVVPASNFGKAKTMVQSIAIIFVLLNLPHSWYVMAAAVLLTVVSGIEYLVRIRRMTGNTVVNLPNLITLIRLILIVPLAILMLMPHPNVTLILTLFSIIAISDKADGLSARLSAQVTSFGKNFDAFTDWLFVIITFVVFIIKNYLTAIMTLFLVLPLVIKTLTKFTYYRINKKFMSPSSIKIVWIVYVAIVAYLIHFKYKNTVFIFMLGVIYISTAYDIIEFFKIRSQGIKKVKNSRKKLNGRTN